MISLNHCRLERDSHITHNHYYKKFINYNIGSKGGCSTRSGQVSDSREANAVQGQLVQNISGSVDKGIQNRVFVKPHSNSSAHRGHTLRLTTSLGEGGDRKAVNKGSNHKSIPRDPRLLLQTVLSPQKRWGHEASHRPKEPQQLHPSSSLQDGGPPYIERSPKKGRLDDQSGSERCIFHDPHPTAGQIIPAILDGKPRLPVLMSAIRPVLCSLGLYQDPEASSNSAQRARVRLVAYIDDILVLAESREMAQCKP